MRYLFGFLCVVALGVMAQVGCTETAGDGGSGGSGGTTGQEFPCTEQGINDAIAEGGGPHTFDCEGPQTVVTEEIVEIDNDVILDGEGNLTVDGNGDKRVLSAVEGVTAELRGLTIRNGAVPDQQDPMGDRAGGIRNDGTLSLLGCVVEGNTHDGVYNAGTLTVIDTAVRGNDTDGIHNDGTLALVDSSTSNNGGGEGIVNDGPLTLTNSTVEGMLRSLRETTATNSTLAGGVFAESGVTLTSSTITEGLWLWNDAVESTLKSSIVDGGCGCGEFMEVDCTEVVTSNGHNIETEGDTCGFDPDGTDMVNVSTEDLRLEDLGANGGPTQTHALLPGSEAINKIPAEDCQVETDQRGKPRPESGGNACDIGAFERQPDDPEP
jgi:hypothetical protein